MTSSAVALNGLLALPVVFAALAGLAARRTSDHLALGLAVLGSAATFGWSIWVAVASGAELGTLDVDVPWIAGMDVRWHLGADGISVPLILMTTLIATCCLLSLIKHAPDCGGRVNLAILLLVIETGVLGGFLALDMVLFFVFFEVALIPMWFVINSWGDAHDEAGRRRAATRFLIFTVLGSALMLVGFMLVYSLAGTFDIVEIAASYSPSGTTAVAASLLVGLGLAVKTPLWPLHIWLPDAHSKAPTVGSVLLAAVLLKLGTYGFIRFWMPVTDPSWELLVPFVAALSVVGIIYAALACLAQTDLKRLIAYSSVGHMGFVVLGAATFTVGGVQAAVYASVAHGLITGLLFFVAGAIKDRYGTADLAQLKVLYGRLPRLAGIFAFAAMASLGLPGLAGFWGEMLAIRSAVDQSAALPENTFTVLAVIAAFGVILTTAYFLALMRGMLQGPLPAGPALSGGAPPGNRPRSSVARLPDPSTPGDAPPHRPGPDDDAPDVGALEWVAWSPLLVLTLVFGVAPGLLLSPISDSARAFFGGL